MYIKSSAVNQQELTAKTQGRGVGVSALIVALMAGVSLPSYSQGALAQDTRGPAAIDEITVTARKREESLQDAPVAITAFSGVQLQERNLTNLMEIGAFVPNVVMNESPSSAGGGNNSQIYIRGVGQTDFLFTTDPGIGIYVDGVYHPRSLGGVMDLLDLERVEVLRGPQGTLFGKNTIGGAVSLVSSKPTGESGGWAEVTLGSYERIDGRASFDFSISDNLFAKVSFSSKNREGYAKRLEFGTGRVLDKMGDENATSARVAFRWLASDSVTVDLTADYTREREQAKPTALVFFDDAGTFGGLGGLWNALVGGPGGQIMSSAFITGDPFTTYATGPNTSDLDVFGTALTIDWELNDNLSLKSISAYRKMEARFGSDSDQSPLQYVETEQDQDQDQFSQELQLIGSNFDSRLNWVAGLFYFNEYGRDDNDVRLVSGLYSALEALPGPLNGSPLAMPTAPGGPGNPINVLLDVDLDVFNEIDITSYAAFAQGTFDLTDQLAVTVGGRYSFEEKDYTLVHTRINSGVPTIPLTTVSNDWDAFTPMASLEYQWTDDFMTYASYSRGFKSGGFNGRPITQSQVDSFDPEEVSSYEIGMKSEWFDRRLQLNVAGFFNDYSDIQLGSISADLNGNLVLRIQNAGEAEIKGFEVELQARPVPGLDIIANVGHTDFEFSKLNPGVVEVTLNTKQVKAPEWTASIGIQYTWEMGTMGDLSLRGDWVYRGEAFQDIQNTSFIEQPSYDVLNGRLVYENAEGDWQAALFVTNVTDELYVTNGFQALGSFGIADLQYGRPREVGFSVKKNF